MVQRFFTSFLFFVMIATSFNCLGFDKAPWSSPEDPDKSVSQVVLLILHCAQGLKAHENPQNVIEALPILARKDLFSSLDQMISASEPLTFFMSNIAEDHQKIDRVPAALKWIFENIKPEQDLHLKLVLIALVVARIESLGSIFDQAGLQTMEILLESDFAMVRAAAARALNQTLSALDFWSLVDKAFFKRLKKKIAREVDGQAKGELQGLLLQMQSPHTGSRETPTDHPAEALERINVSQTALSAISCKLVHLQH
ncbi:MAG: hypothetical protein C5B49_00310 [Bdellovibrio sp.]|nr:MAG: hypothetical protein C5B49_00310 [Bdellovibrio sp.]